MGMNPTNCVILHRTQGCLQIHLSLVGRGLSKTEVLEQHFSTFNETEIFLIIVKKDFKKISVLSIV